MNKTIIFYDLEATSVSRDADMVSIGLVAVTEKLNPDWKEYRKKYLMTHVEEQHKIPEYIGNKIDIEIKTFYAEFTDFNIDKCDDWVKENVVDKLRFKNRFHSFTRDSLCLQKEIFISDEADIIKYNLKNWLSQFDSLEFWADFDVIDKPMLIDLIADWDTVNPNNFKFNSRTEVEEFGRTLKDVKIGLPKHLPNIKYDQFFDLHTLFKIKGIDTDINREEFIGDLIKEIPEGNKHNALYDCYVAWKCYDKLMSI